MAQLLQVAGQYLESTFLWGNVNRCSVRSLVFGGARVSSAEITFPSLGRWALRSAGVRRGRQHPGRLSKRWKREVDLGWPIC